MSKNFLKKTLIALLALEARLVIRKYQPRIIGVTGSVGKTMVKDAIFCVLKDLPGGVAKSQKSFNSELGVPLSILRAENAWGNVAGWLKNLIEGLALIIFRYPYPKWLVLEVGIDRPGDMLRSLRGIKLDVAVITRLPELPVHLELFNNKEDVAKEKLKILKALKTSGFVVANGDDEKIRIALSVTNKKIIYYGYHEGANYLISNEHLLYNDNTYWPLGMTFKINFGGSSLPVRAKVFSKEQVLGLAPALVLANENNLEMLKAIEALDNYHLPPGRLQPLKGTKDTIIFDDTYNSSPTALESALIMLSNLRVLGRRIVVLGDMMELGAYTMEAHRNAGIMASNLCNIIIGVGMRAKFIVDEAVKKRFGKRKTAHFIEAGEAGKYLERLLKPGDVVLVKGSQSMRLERIVEEVLAEPDRAHELLCRQESEWKKR
ncbi:MAG: UDP-N-acetylmuramoyl-tripeptide--D-alanyl-D-alanine ligase [Patescibacteria group bacterium]